MGDNMKKIILILLIISMTSLIIAQDIIIRDIDSPDGLNGSQYFPLFVGAKWIWDVKGMGNITKINWELVSAHKITDTKNNLGDLTAFKLKISFDIEEKEMTDEFYVFEYQAFICFYRKVGNDYKIEKVIPVNPLIDNKWVANNTEYKVVERKDNTVKIESVNEEIDKYGYQIFIKDIGPYEIFEYYSSGEKKEDVMMTLVDSVAYEDLYEKPQQKIAEEIPQEDKELYKENNTPQENKKEEKPHIVLNENDYIQKLSNDKKYLQIGAFNIVYYAEELVRNAKYNGFEAKIYRDIDGFYKVLIEVNSENDINNVKNKITKDAFIKK